MFRYALAAAAVGLGLPLAAHADYSTDFTGFSLGTINGQQGWLATGSWDEEIIDLSGDLKWRVSNAVTAGSFGDQPFSPAFAPLAGEPGAGATANVFLAEFDFQSVTGAAQPNLALTISPDPGTGARMSFLNITDDGTGLAVGFYDYDMTIPDSGSGFAGFHFSQLASALDYGQPHKLRIGMHFVDGPDKSSGTPPEAPNDVVMVWIDDTLVHTGTSWEEYFPENQPGNAGPHLISQLLFRLSGTAEPGNNGNGLYIDNLNVQTLSVADRTAFLRAVSPAQSTPDAGSGSGTTPVAAPQSIPTQTGWHLGLVILGLGLLGLRKQRRH